ncbi:MAG: gliding motility-associated ABC transporter permease subunit GldF [Bacteroidetes bacterium]|nr:gliding motility-associated ABC transporter permease subunit GldF [Bacteroidota bacterium]
MWPVCKKELRQFFSGLTGYLAIGVFLAVNGVVLFVFNDNLFDFGYATLDPFFALAPWVLLFLIPAITMRSFSDEFRTGTYEILQAQPISTFRILFGKYLAALLVVFIALVPTLLYAFTINQLAADQGLDTGATAGAYFGLILLAGVFAAIGLYCSSLTSNAVVAFLLAALGCGLIHYGAQAISQLPIFLGTLDYYLEMVGIEFHYRSIRRGLLDSRDLIYFLSVIATFLLLTQRNLQRRK